MSKSTEISVNEWLDELVALGRKNDEGHTTAELAAAAGCTVKAMCARLNQARALGRLTLGFRSIQRIDGRMCQTPVYRVTAPKKAKR